MQGEASLWGVAEYLLAAIHNRLADANWQRSGDQAAAKPKPILPPGAKNTDEQIKGSNPIPIKDFDAWWDTPATE